MQFRMKVISIGSLWRKMTIIGDGVMGCELVTTRHDIMSFHNRPSWTWTYLDVYTASCPDNGSLGNIVIVNHICTLLLTYIRKQVYYRLTVLLEMEW